MERVSIISVNFNGWEVTCQMLESLYRHLEHPFECIVVDNGSTRDESLLIGQAFPQVRVFRSEHNLGFAGANNLGMRMASGTHFLLLNNDTIVEEDILKPLLDRFRMSARTGAVGPKIRFEGAGRPIQFAGYTPMTRISIRNWLIGCDEPDLGQYDEPKRTPAILGAAMMVSREAVESSGLMPEVYFLYYEELDWCELIHRAGWEMWYEPAATVFHKGSVTVGGKESPVRAYYQTRNRLLFARRNRALCTRWLSYIFQVFLACPKECIRFGLRGRGDLIPFVLRGIRDFVLKKDSFLNPGKLCIS
jgi:GT2 family glycosyltransferase